MPVDVIGRVTEKRIVARDTLRLVVDAPSIAEVAVPGQFVMLGQSVPTSDPFLRRPFAIAGAGWGRIELLIRVVGLGSALLASVDDNDQIKILGPLGNGFPTPSGEVFLVAGGIGLAPLLFAERKWPKSRLLYGESNRDWLCDLSREKTCFWEVSTDDGSEGFRCTVVDLLKAKLETEKAPVYACGPEAMLSAVAELCKSVGVECYVSLEERMACGVGACQGCVIYTEDGYKRVCKDGPVFSAQKVNWEALNDRSGR
ncbi:dihydroorotate dehydrogenase electron transfer subunit [bacterium]|nr:dihydroorotate dehydrogenase electron transfer subunit [bacterium]